MGIKNYKLKIALIGGGITSSIGPAHLTAINSSNKWKIICGVFSKNHKRPPKLLNQSDIRIYKSLKSLIENEKNKIDCFLLLTPPKENKKIINIIKKTKIPIISEKPIFDNLNNLNSIKNYIKKNNIKFLTTYNYSFYPALRELQYLVNKEKKKFRKIIIEMPQQGFFLKNSKIKSWRKTDGYIPNLFLDLGSHIYNLVYFLLNEYPESLICKTYTKNRIIVDANIWCKFKKSTEGVFWISKNAGGHENDLKIEIFFENKSYLWEHKNSDTIYYNDNFGKKVIINRSSKNLKYFNNIDLNIYKPGHPTGFVETFINFYNKAYKNIISKKNLIKENDYNFDHSYKIIKILTAMKKSSQNKIWTKTNVK